MDAIIGYTGFVGSNLMLSHQFDKTFNSKNIGDIGNHDFDVVVCAAPQAVKWWANKHPEEDWQGIEKLIADLKNIKTKKFVHLSTIDVFPSLAGVDESLDCKAEENHAYGRHRLQLEHTIQDMFEHTHIIRLPALFGQGLKKNVIYDLLNDHMLEVINPESSFQWYGLNRLWQDIQTVITADIDLCVLATEPVATGTIISNFFPNTTVGAQANTAHYDVYTKHAAAFGQSGNYMLLEADVLADMGKYIASARAEQEQT